MHASRLIARARYFGGIALLVGLLTACPPAPSGTDLTVDNIEVTQAIQTPSNTIELVAQRSTTVRVTVDTNASVPVSGVTGILHVFVDGIRVTPTAGVAAQNIAITAPPSPDRGNADDTLNFELTAPTGITASTDVDFEVELIVAGEADTSNNIGRAENLTFVEVETPTIYYTSIDYTPAGLGLPDTALIEPGVGDAFVRGIFPVDDSDADFYQQGLFPTLPFNDDSNGNGVLDSSPDGDSLLSFLASCRQLIVAVGLGATDQTFLYGWIAGNPISGNGYGQINGFNGYGNTQEIRHQRTFAHELGHNVGLNHNSRSLDEVGWDTDARLDGNPAANNTTGRLKGTTLNDIMRGGQLTNSAWVDTTTYQFFQSSASFPASLMATPTQQEEIVERVLVVQGIFDPTGEELLRLEPAFRFPWRSQPSPAQADGAFRVEVIDDLGQSYIVFFDALNGDDAGEVPGEGEQHGFFEVMVPVPPQREAVSLEVTDATGQVSFGGFQEAVAPSEVFLFEPDPGDTLGEQTPVAWELNTSVPDSQLQYQVAYSPDGGESWVPIAVDVPGTERSITFDSTRIQASSGNGIIRVFVSNGLETTFDEVTGLSTSAARF